MFDFLNMADDYESRKIGRHDGDKGLMISTAEVSDGEYPYETAVAHSDYNKGEMVIVESYSQKNIAEKGHARWVKLMTSNKLPAKLTDCGNSGISQLIEGVGGQMVFPRKLKVKK